MATSSSDDSRSADDARSAHETRVRSESEKAHAGDDTRSNGGLASLADKLDTAATVLWASFLASVILFTLVPVAGLWLGVVPFEPPETTPYFAFVGLTLVGTVALVAAGVFDV